MSRQRRMGGVLGRVGAFVWCMGSLAGHVGAELCLPPNLTSASEMAYTHTKIFHQFPGQILYSPVMLCYKHALS